MVLKSRDGVAETLQEEYHRLLIVLKDTENVLTVTSVIFSVYFFLLIILPAQYE